jgi:hypothetical protein
MCLCCTTAFCGKCYYGAEFATVKGNKGFCRPCSKLALLIENNADIDSDGVRYFFSIMPYYVMEKKETETCNSIWNPKVEKLGNLFTIYVYLQFEIFCHEFPMFVVRLSH